MFARVSFQNGKTRRREVEIFRKEFQKPFVGLAFLRRGVDFDDEIAFIDLFHGFLPRVGFDEYGNFHTPFSTRVHFMPWPETTYARSGQPDYC